MPRNGSGSMSIPNSFSSGTVVSSSAVNANFTDIAAEITNSLAKDGQSTMTGQIKAATGSVAAPSITFGTDSDTGFYRKATGVIGVVSDAAEIGTLSSAGFTDSAGVVAKGFPSGTVMLFVQTAAPTGWTKSTDHNDKALRVVSGNAGTGGTTAFTSIFAARTITQENLPDVTLETTITDPGHTHVQRGDASGGTASRMLQATGNGGNTVSSVSTASATTGITASTALGGSGTAVDFDVLYVDVIIATKD